MQIAFIGGGVMAEAMTSGILVKGLTKPHEIAASDISPSRRAVLSEKYGIETKADNRQAIKGADVVVLAIKPQTLAEVMEELRGILVKDQLVLSIVAGASIATIRSSLEHNLVVRAMPNLPAQIGEGMTVWTAAQEVSEIQKGMAKSILAAIGKEIYVANEGYIDMATAVSGSGPAYIFLVIESLIDAAVHIGLPREIAGDLVLQTAFGAVRFVQESGKHPAELRNMVTSPGGTTAEGLLKLEEGGLRAILNQAVIAACRKAQGG